jgi:hypothetical protein
MEVRLISHGRDSLATKVFFSDEGGFEVASVIVMGKTDAVLIDVQWTLSNAHRVIAEILETSQGNLHYPCASRPLLRTGHYRGSLSRSPGRGAPIGSSHHQ